MGLFLNLALLSTALALTGAHGGPNVDQSLDWESADAAIEGDDTSLLQLGVHFPLDGDSGKAEWLYRRAAAVSNADAWQADIPEASFAWALYQRVHAGPPRPWTLTNDTNLEPPGDLFPDEAAILKANISKHNTKLYKESEHPDRATAPSWLWECMGQDYDINNYTPWTVEFVATPQLVPFVVHADHPNRTDVSVVIVPGGGSTALTWESETDVAKWFNLLGISAFVLKYRIPQPVPWSFSAAVMDAQRAVSLVRHMAPSLGLNASRIGLFGASEGGRVATFSAFAAGRQYTWRDVVDDNSPRPDFLLLLYPTLDLTAFYERTTSPSPTGVHNGVVLTNLADAMPLYIANGAKDRCCTVEDLYTFHSYLRKRGDPTVELNIYADVGHGFNVCYRAEKGGWEAMQHEACLWMLRARRFIMWYVEKKAPSQISYWYQRTVKFDSSLLVTKSSR